MPYLEITPELMAEAESAYSKMVEDAIDKMVEILKQGLGDLPPV